MLYNIKVFKYIDKLYPIVLLNGIFIALTLQCVFYDFFDNKMYLLAIVYMVLFCIIDLIIGIKFLCMFKEKRKNRLFIYKSVIVICVFILLYLYAMFKYKDWSNGSYNNYTEMLSLLLKFIVLKLPICLTLIIVLVENSAKKFICNFKWYGIVLVPIAVFYIGRMILGDSNDIAAFLSIKNIDYMTIGIIFITFLMTVSLDFIINSYSKIINVIICFLILISWITVLYTGTRSTFIVGLFFAMILIIWELALNHGKSLKKTLIPVLTIVIIAVISFSVWAPKYSGVSIRMNNFIYEDANYEKELTINGAIDSERGYEIQQDFTTYIVNSEQPYSDSIKDIRDDIKHKNEKIVDLKTVDNIDALLEYQLEFNRITLWRFAYMEFQKHPILGNGIAYHMNKYNGFHPHCMLFEFLADIGIVGTVFMCLLFFILLFKAIKIARRDTGLMSMLILAISFIPIYLLSSGFFTNVNVVYTVFLLIFVVLYNRNYNSRKKNPDNEINSFFVSYGDCRYDGRLRELIKTLGLITNVSGISRGGDISYKIVKDHDIFISESRFCYLKFIVDSIKLARSKNKIDILFADNRKSLIPAYIIKVICKPDFIVQDMRELYLIRASESIAYKAGCIIEKNFIKCADLIICANQERARIVRKIFKCNATVISYENIRRLEYNNKNIKEYEKKYSQLFNKNSFNLISTAGVDMSRLTDKLIYAVNCVKYPVELYLIGGGSKEDYSSVKKIVKENGFKNIHILGLVNQNELKYLINACHCGVVNYHMGDLNNKYCASGKIFEFIFEGKPVIATNNVTLKKICKQYKVGVASENLEFAIKTIIENYETYRNNAESLSKLLDPQSNNEYLAYQIKKVYEDACMKEKEIVNE